MYFWVDSIHFSSPLSAVLHWGDVWERQRHGGDSGQRRLLSNHRRARAEPRGGAKHPESDAFLRHVRFLRAVCFPRQCLLRSHFHRCFCTRGLFYQREVLPLFQVGLPAKSGVAGGILLVVPNVMGIMCWSPPLDKLGNSVRGIQFCTVTSAWTFHTTMFLSVCSLTVPQCQWAVVHSFCSSCTGTRVKSEWWTGCVLCVLSGPGFSL